MSHPGLKVFANEVLFANSVIDEEYLDQQLSKVTGYWVEGDLKAIVKQGKLLLDQEIYDLRFSGYYLYSLWVTEKKCALVDVLRALFQLLKQQPAVWLPVEMSLDQPSDDEDQAEITAAHRLVQASLSMLFNRISQRLNRFSAEQDAEEVEPCEIIVLCDQLSDLLVNQLGVAESAGSLNDIARFHSDACRAESPQPDEADSLFGEVLEEEDAVADVAEAEKEEVLSPLAPLFTDESNRPNEQSTPKHSIPLQQLLDRVQVFEALMQQQELYKAAIVYQEIQTELNDFNPLKYLPELFSRFAGVRALYAQPLHELLEQQDTVQWLALKEYFIADPVGYQQLAVDTESLGLVTEQSDQRVQDEPYDEDLEDDDDFDIAEFRQREQRVDRSRLFDND